MDNQRRPPDGFQKRRHFHKLPLACLECRRKKSRCSGEFPSCYTCGKAGSECVYKGRNGDIWTGSKVQNLEFLPAEASTTEGEDRLSTVIRPAYESQTILNGHHRQRILAACAACRRRKTRCPGERPSCVPCIRSGLTCVYETRKGKSHAIAPVKSVTPPPDFTPLTFEAAQISALGQLDQEFNQWKHRQRLKACAHCRRRKIGCDAARPCGVCLKSGMDCVEFDPSQIAAEQSPEHGEYASSMMMNETAEEQQSAQVTWTPTNLPGSINGRPASWAPKRPHKCDKCHLTFVRAEHLKRHLPIHTGERPFVCPHENCGKAFSRADQLLRHRRTHQDFIEDNDPKPKPKKSRAERELDSQVDGNARICYGCEKRFESGNAFYGHWPCFGGTQEFKEALEGKVGSGGFEKWTEDHRPHNNFGDFVSQLQRAATDH